MVEFEFELCQLGWNGLDKGQTKATKKLTVEKNEIGRFNSNSKKTVSNNKKDETNVHTQRGDLSQSEMNQKIVWTIIVRSCDRESLVLCSRGRFDSDGKFVQSKYSGDETCGLNKPIPILVYVECHWECAPKVGYKLGKVDVL